MHNAGRYINPFKRFIVTLGLYRVVRRIKADCLRIVFEPYNFPSGIERFTDIYNSPNTCHGKIEITSFAETDMYLNVQTWNQFCFFDREE